MYILGMFTYNGVFSVIIFLQYALLMVLLLNEPPKTCKQFILKTVEYTVWTTIFHLFGVIYYEIIGEAYLNQFKEVSFAICYALFRSKYTIERRIVMLCSGYTLYVLWIGVVGSSFIKLAIFRLIFVFAGIIFIIYFLRKYVIKEFWIKPSWYIVVVVTLALCGVTASANWKNEPVSNLYLFVSNLSLLLTTIVLYRLLFIVNSFYEEQLELQATKQKLKADEEFMALLNKNKEELHVLRHELKNHDAYISDMISHQKYDELQEYLKADSGRLVKIQSMVMSNNNVVDAIVNQKAALADINGIKTSFQFAIPEHIKIDELDLRSLLSNILDNAIEASTQSADKKYIHFSMRQEVGYIFLHVENSVNKAQDKQQRLSLKTTKTDTVNHGYGTKIVNRIVDKYKGYVEYRLEGDTFITDIMLAVEEV